MGFTTVDPTFITADGKISVSSTEVYFSSEHWMLSGSAVFHNKQEKIIPSDINSLNPEESAAIAVDSKGDLHFFHKGKHESVIWNGLPKKPLRDLFTCVVRLAVSKWSFCKVSDIKIIFI